MAGLLQSVVGILYSNLCPEEKAYQLGKMIGVMLMGLAGGLAGPKMAPAPTKCFVAGTLVVMADGTLKPIERIEKGDEVLSKDEKSGELVARPVTDKQTKYTEATLVLWFSDGQNIETTDEHPFYVEGKGWQRADELGIGTSIVTRAGPSVSLTAIERKNKGQVVYNFSVEEHQNYFVRAPESSSEQEALWVHNYGEGQPDAPGPRNPTVSDSPAPDLSPTGPPQRYHGPWTPRDIERAKNGQGPLDFVPQTNRAGREVPLELHHADQMPGSAVHELPPFHPTIPGSHPNKYNQGVTSEMRAQDAQLHWYMRVMEMGY